MIEVIATCTTVQLLSNLSRLHYLQYGLVDRFLKWLLSSIMSRRLYICQPAAKTGISAKSYQRLPNLVICSAIHILGAAG
jgi:hypothetical protein